MNQTGNLDQASVQTREPSIVSVSVSDIRQSIYRVQTNSGPGNRSHAALGTVFHRSMASMLQRDRQDLAAVFAGQCVDDWAQELSLLAYRNELAPFLKQNAAAMQGRGQAALDLWAAIGHASRWLAELFWDHRNRLIAAGLHSNPADFARWFESEVPLTMTLDDPDWSGPVSVRGVADSILTTSDGRRCVIEYKLGQTSPEADLCQTLLYRMMLDQMGSGESESALAVVSFLPQRSERLIVGSSANDIHADLKALIGRVAGVLKNPETKAIQATKTIAPKPLGLTGATPAAKPALGESQFGEPALGESPLAESGSSRLVNSNPTEAFDREAIQDRSRQLLAALSEANCRATIVGDPIVGPTFVRFVLSPARGVAPSKFQRAADIIQVRLNLQRPPVIGTGASITIDLQRPDRQAVLWDSITLPDSDPIHGCAKVIVGVGIDGQLRTADLADSSSYHLLVAGTSGSGKSEWIRTAVAGLIATNTPEQLQLVAIDPKRVAFHDLQGSPYLRRPVVFPGDVQSDVFAVLDDLIDEMERRYEMFDGCSDLAELIQRRGEALPRIVCVCDEYADFILSNAAERREIENRIARLGAKARAAGIHLILATQQPSRQTISGAIQTNLPGRVGLTMTSATESRMLFGESGAENLLMRGDLLYKDLGSPLRYQAVYLPAEKRRELFAQRRPQPAMR